MHRAPATTRPLLNRVCMFVYTPRLQIDTESLSGEDALAAQALQQHTGVAVVLYVVRERKAGGAEPTASEDMAVRMACKVRVRVA